MAMLRVLWLLLLLLCVIVGWVACCKDNLECSLNGKCDTRTAKCICERGWTGSDCSTLNLLPPANNTGYVPANGSSSWGGSVVKGHDGKYHMFVSQFANKCGCDVWYPNSQIVHTISDLPQGPYRYHSLVFPTFHHNPKVYRAMDGNYIMYFIGANNGGHGVKNCTTLNKLDVVAADDDDNANEDGGPMMANICQTSPTNCIGLVVSSDLYNWKMVSAPVINGRAGHWDEVISNPSALFFSNGSVILLYRGKHQKIERLGVAYAPHWRGPYKQIGSQPIFPMDVLGEDPDVWGNEKTGFHLLFHWFKPHSCCNSPYGRSAASKDGVHWRLGDGIAYEAHVGPRETVYRIERPHMIVRETDGSPNVLLTGIFPSGHSAYTYTLAQLVG